MYEDMYSKYVNKGVFYIYKRDRAYRPILILNAQKLCYYDKLDPWSIDDILKFTSFVL